MSVKLTLQERQAIQKQSRKHGEVWKMDGLWYVQFRGARHSFTRKGIAMEWQKVLQNIDEEAFIKRMAEAEKKEEAMSMYESGRDFE